MENNFEEIKWEFMNKEERVQWLKETIDNCLQIFENDESELDDPGTYFSCGMELDVARYELKEIMSSEEYDQLDQKYRYWKSKK